MFGMLDFLYNQGMETSHTSYREERPMVRPAVAIDLSIGDRLFAARTERGLSQSELSRRAGVNRASVIFTENGRTIPRPSTVRKLAWALGTTVEELTGEVPAEKQ